MGHMQHTIAWQLILQQPEARPIHASGWQSVGLNCLCRQQKSTRISPRTKIVHGGAPKPPGWNIRIRYGPGHMGHGSQKWPIVSSKSYPIVIHSSTNYRNVWLLFAIGVSPRDCELNTKNVEWTFFGTAINFWNIPTAMKRFAIRNDADEPVNMGVLSDKNLNKKSQISNISRTCFFHLRRLHSVRQQLTSHVVTHCSVEPFEILDWYCCCFLDPSDWDFYSKIRCNLGCCFCYRKCYHSDAADRRWERSPWCPESVQ